MVFFPSDGIENLTDNQCFQLVSFFGRLALRSETRSAVLAKNYMAISFEIQREYEKRKQTWGDREEEEFRLFYMQKSSDSYQQSWKKLSALLKEEETPAVTHFPVEDDLKTSLKSRVVDVLKRYGIHKLIARRAAPVEETIPTNEIKAGGKADPRTWNAVLITGWYGTETTGDKAILGEIIHCIRFWNKNTRIYITSIDYRVSFQTRKEMGFDATHIPIDQAASSGVMDAIDAVIMGGGPLMESNQIRHIARLFEEANRLGRERIIFGCGVGPIHTPPMEALIGRILAVSTRAFFRDQESHDYARRLGMTCLAEVACDPALAFVNRWHRSQGAASPQHEVVATQFREQTREYARTENVEEINTNLKKTIAATMERVSGKDNLFWNLVPMHMYFRGNDDRQMNGELLRMLPVDGPWKENEMYLTLEEVMQILAQSTLSISMRYHGHVFSVAMALPFISLDYTGNKGKVYNLVSRLGLSEWQMKVDGIGEDMLSQKLMQLRIEAPRIKKQLEEGSQALLDKLEKTYTNLWP